MEDTIVSLRFTDLERAREALHDLERADREGRLEVRGAALVQRSGQGGIDTPPPDRDQEGHYLPPSGSVGMLLDVLRGPRGVLSPSPNEDYRGHGAGSIAHERDRELALDELSRSLEPGITLVIAELAEPDPDALDSVLGAFDASVTRRPARDVYAEIEAADAR